MKIAIQTWGSNGDIRPMLALAEGLQKKGHQLTLVVSSIDNKDYSAICQRLNITYQRVPQQLCFDMPAFALKTMHMNSVQWLQALLDEAFLPYEEEIYQAAVELAQQHDCVIAHHFLYPLKIAAKQYNKPYISITLCHAAIKQNGRPPFRFPDLGKTLNGLQWKLFNLVFDWAYKPRLGQLWRLNNMPEIKHVYPDLLSSDLLNLVAVDEHFCAQNTAWSTHHQQCGFFNLSETAQTWIFPESLTQFLERGEKPVYMTFGSLQQAVPDWSMELFIAATRLAGCRAIIQTSSARYQAESQQDNIYFIGKHPHQALFERCVAVVHHGGAGTSHSASLSACASIVVPFMDEQLFWAMQLQDAGLAGAPLKAKKANAKRLARRIVNILQHPEYAQRALQVSKAMQRSNGVQQAIRLIEQYVFL